MRRKAMIKGVTFLLRMTKPLVPEVRSLSSSSLKDFCSQPKVVKVQIYTKHSAQDQETMEWRVK